MAYGISAIGADILVYRAAPVNDRQRDILNRLLDGFEGKLPTLKYAKIETCSQDTTHRDIIGLIGMGALGKDNTGRRSTSYSLVEGQGAGPSDLRLSHA